MNTIVDSTTIPAAFGEVIDIASVADEPSAWLALGFDGRVARVDSRSGEFTEMGALEIPDETRPWRKHPTPRLHASNDGKFVAVANDYGQQGSVYNARSWQPTLILDGGDYFPRLVSFSFAFVNHEGRTLAIHRTNWNRLDVSDAATGELLTSRGPTNRIDADDEPPAHYLDYFHGGLTVSPDGRLIVDDGWIWHPLGAPAVWNLDAWFNENVWESEDGQSRMHVCAREWYWDEPICWIDSTRIAVSGIGDDKWDMAAGVRVFTNEVVHDPSAKYLWDSARELATIVGPRGDLFSDGARLFSAADDGLSIWDAETGAAIGVIDGFQPTRQHRATRELVQVTSGVLRWWRY